MKETDRMTEDRWLQEHGFTEVHECGIWTHTTPSGDFSVKVFRSLRNTGHFWAKVASNINACRVEEDVAETKVYDTSQEALQHLHTEVLRIAEIVAQSGGL